MQGDIEDIDIDPLFVGLTRPATVFGIPYIAFVIEIMVTAIAFIATLNLFYLALAVPIHAILYLIGAHDPGIFNSIYIWLKTIGRCRNSRFWGAASFSPLATKKWVK